MNQMLISEAETLVSMILEDASANEDHKKVANRLQMLLQEYRSDENKVSLND